MRTPRHQNLVRAAVAALVLLGSLGGFTAAGIRPAAAAPPAARVHAYGVPAFPDLVSASKPVVGVTATPSGAGYWLVGSDGGIFSYGGAPFFGSTGGIKLAKPVVGMAATPTGLGYWLVASDGGIFAYGDAGFHGSTGGVALRKPVVGMAATPTGLGYWLAASDGGIFAFGDAPFRGSPVLHAGRQVVAIATAALGYWLADTEIPPPPIGPPLPPGSGEGRRIVYCVSCQRTWHVGEDGLTVRSFLVSGRIATPRAGTYSVFSKSRVSSSGSVTMEYMVRFAHGRTLAIGFHAIPRTSSGTPIQSEAQLGTYRSHGCVRQADRDALATWNFAPVGTKVVVTP